jgi:hypothetical protein
MFDCPVCGTHSSKAIATEELLVCGDSAVSTKFASLDTGQAARRSAIERSANRQQTPEKNVMAKDAAQGLCHLHKAWVVADPGDEIFATHALCFSTGI